MPVKRFLILTVLACIIAGLLYGEAIPAPDGPEGIEWLLVEVWGGRSKAREKREGTLVLDFINPESKSLIWRGTATSTINPHASQDEQRELINRAVAEMMMQFPPQKQ